MNDLDFTVQQIDDDLTYEIMMDEIYETVFENINSVGGVNVIEEVLWEPSGLNDDEFIEREYNHGIELDDEEIVWVPDHLEYIASAFVPP